MLKDLGWLKKVKIWDGTRVANISPENELLVRETAQVLFDEHFNNTELNTDKWTANSIGSGSVMVSDSICHLNVTTNNGDSAEIYSIQTYENIFSQTYSFRCIIILDEISINNNIRIWGMRNPITNDGWYFSLENGVLYACTEYNGTVTKVNIDTFKPTDGNVHRYDGIYRNYQILFYIDEKLVYTSTADLIPLYKNEELKIYFRNYNIGTTNTNVTLKVEGVALFDDTSSFIQLAGLDDTGCIKKVAVSSTRRLLVSQEPPSAPPETTPVIITEYGQVSGLDDIEWVIPDGETVTIQRLSAGAEPAGGSNVELWYDPDGTKTNMQIIDVIFTDGQSDQHDLNDTFTGDGVAQIVMRRTGIGSSNARLIFGRWEGYY